MQKEETAADLHDKKKTKERQMRTTGPHMLRLKTGLEGEESKMWLELCVEFKENGLLKNLVDMQDTLRCGCFLS